MVRSAKARRLKLKIRSSGVVEVILPPRVKEQAGLQFLNAELDWLEQVFKKVEAPVLFQAGEVIPLLGVDHAICHRPDAKRGVWAEDGQINISGSEAHLPRRLRDWLKRQARVKLLDEAAYFADEAGLSFARLSVRDQKSRWGSCSSEGNLNFSWRLYLMPEPILRYVVAHEIAHLQHMNHGPDFWALVERIYPDVKSARVWMKKNAGTYHKYDATH